MIFPKSRHYLDQGCTAKGKNRFFCKEHPKHNMRSPSVIWFIPLLLFILSCRSDHDAVSKRFDQLKSEDPEQYTLVYAYSTYLSTTRSIEPEEALPLVLELISFGNYTEARYCVDNLMRNGIQSYDLLALRGLCYFNELQTELALTDLEKAHTGDPDNAKIKTLLDQVKGIKDPEAEVDELLASAGEMIMKQQYDASDQILNAILEQDRTSHQALYYKGLIRLQRTQYDSAHHYMSFARSSEPLEEYSRFIAWIEKVFEGERMIATNPGSFTGYIEKSQGLSSMRLFDEAHNALNRGLERNPDNLNLILAKALVWVQAGEAETAREYLSELEQRGLQIDPALKQRIFQNQP